MTTPPVKQFLPRILIVDDNSDAANTLADVLAYFGYEAVVAYSGVEALAMGETHRPQLVFLDIGMPEMDGFEVAARMRELSWGKQSVIIALTAWSDEPTRRRVMSAGMDHHLTKPAPIGRVLDIAAAMRP